MLQTIDILLGVTVVMLVVSMAVTVLTQFVISVCNTRGRHLLYGLADLMQQIDPGIQRDVAERICGTVLSHPLIREVGQRYGSAIHREEFTKLLMDLAAGNIPQTLANKLDGETKKILLATLHENGIQEPEKTLDNVRSMALQLEISRPELANNIRHSMALMEEANSQFLAKINSWFDQTIDRVSDRFTFTTRGITFACSLVMAVAIQLDTIDLINRLSVDEQLRTRLVEKAFELGDVANTPPAIASNLSPTQREDLRQMLQLGVIRIAKSPDEWRKNWDHVSLPGVLLSSFMLSLGAPFWYGALKNLLKLRSTLASKDDSQRGERQTDTAPKSAPDKTVPPPVRIGERGILG